MQTIKQDMHAPAAPASKPQDQATDVALKQIRDLIYGESRREMTEQLEHLLDRQREFEDWTRREARRIADEARASEKRHEEARRALVTDLSASVESMAKAIAKLAEK